MVIYYFAVFFVLIALLPFLPIKHWVVRGWDYVRTQTCILQLVTLILTYWLVKPDEIWQWVIFLSLLAAFLMQLIIVLPYTKLYSLTHKAPPNKKDLYRLSILTANIFQDNRDYDSFCKLIETHKPDIFLTMESDKKWEQQLDRFSELYAYTVKIPISNYYGMHLYSKFKLSDTEIKYQVEQDIPSIFTKVHFNHTATLNLICVHPAPPSPTENETSKERDAELLITGKKVRELDAPTMVCGDLNDVVWSRVSKLFSKMTGLVDPRVGRGLYPTFHADYWYLRFPIDHMFHSRDIHLEHMRRLPHYGSDHFAMYFSFMIEAHGHEETAPEISQETSEEIEKNIKEGLENQP